MPEEHWLTPTPTSAPLNSIKPRSRRKYEILINATFRSRMVSMETIRKSVV